MKSEEKGYPFGMILNFIDEVDTFTINYSLFIIH